MNILHIYKITGASKDYSSIPKKSFCGRESPLCLSSFYSRNEIWNRLKIWNWSGRRLRTRRVPSIIYSMTLNDCVFAYVTKIYTSNGPARCEWGIIWVIFAMPHKRSAYKTSKDEYVSPQFNFLFHIYRMTGDGGIILLFGSFNDTISRATTSPSYNHIAFFYVHYYIVRTFSFCWQNAHEFQIKLLLPSRLP